MTSAHRLDDGTPGGELTDREKSILDFEREWWQHTGHKDEAIRRSFELSPARYYQVLNALTQSPAALAYDPMLVKRLIRAREDRRSKRESE